MNVSVPNASEYWPTLTADGTVLIFESGRSLQPLPDGGYFEDKSRIWVATRANNTFVQGVGAAASQIKNLGAGVNTATDESAPVVSSSDLVLYFARGLIRHIYKSSRARPTDDFGPAELVTELSTLDAGIPTAYVEEYPSWISPDDCRLYFVRTVNPGDGGPTESRLWVASRPRLTSP